MYYEYSWNVHEYTHWGRRSCWSEKEQDFQLLKILYSLRIFVTAYNVTATIFDDILNMLDKLFLSEV